MAKKGGSTYGRSGANGANPFKRRFFLKEYPRRDYEYYAPKRRDIIKHLLNTEVDPKQLDKLVYATYGLTVSEIQSVIAFWEQTTSLPIPSKNLPPRDPVSGAFEERLISERNIRQYAQGRVYSTTSSSGLLNNYNKAQVATALTIFLLVLLGLEQARGRPPQMPRYGHWMA